jgi:hypothetical protein
MCHFEKKTKKNKKGGTIKELKSRMLHGSDQLSCA